MASCIQCGRAHRSLYAAQVLATAEPAAAVAAFRESLEAALAGPQDADRPRTYAAAEVLAGLLASGALFAADAGAALHMPKLSRELIVCMCWRLAGP